MRLANWDGTQARAEGWRIYESKDRPLQLWAYVGSSFHKRAGTLFSGADKLALQFVKDRAAEGSAYHIEALMLLQLS